MTAWPTIANPRFVWAAIPSVIVDVSLARRSDIRPKRVDRRDETSKEKAALLHAIYDRITGRGLEISVSC